MTQKRSAEATHRIGSEPGQQSVPHFALVSALLFARDNSQQFDIAQKTFDDDVTQEELDRAITIMKTAQPGGVTPLIKHIQEIKRSVTELEPQLRADGCRVAIILATDGVSSLLVTCGWCRTSLALGNVDQLIFFLHGIHSYLLMREATEVRQYNSNSWRHCVD